MPARLLLLLALATPLLSQTGENVLLVINRKSESSRQLGDYYRAKRSIPQINVCYLDATTEESIVPDVYEKQIERPVGVCLTKNGLQEKVLYIVLTMGLPLRVTGAEAQLQSEYSSVDSELALLYSKLKGVKYPRAGGVPNPFFGKRYATFRHPGFPIYMVTRLAGYDVAEAKAAIDRGLVAKNRGKFVIDLGASNEAGDEWLRDAATLLPADRLVLEETKTVLYDQKNVIGYASWGSNDKHRTQRWSGFQFLPGAIVTEFVSTNGRTLKRPPDSWTFGTWQDPSGWFMGAPQSLSLDYIHEGATGVSGNVSEPYLVGCARPNYVLPAWYEGRNLAESYYLGLPFLSWQGVIFGDPLCALGKPARSGK